MDWRRGRNLIDVLIGGSQRTAPTTARMQDIRWDGAWRGHTIVTATVHCAQLPAPATRARVISCLKIYLDTK